MARKKPAPGSPSPEVLEVLENQNVVEVDEEGRPISPDLPKIEVPESVKVPTSPSTGGLSPKVENFQHLPGIPTEFNYSLHDQPSEIAPPIRVEEIGKGIKVTSEADFEKLMGELKGKRRTVQLDQERWNLQKDLYKLEGNRVGADIERINTLSQVQKWNQATLKLTTERVKTARAGVHLRNELINLNGEMQESALLSAEWDLKIDDLQTDFDEAKRVLKAKKQALLNAQDS
ncbi:hypothetical protein NDI45_25220 [Leptolyngbya sp. GB1-A1]|uniref:hypothetical protein n=1 Tax=Leptolyngbya sp. GB1-A1 TaxID=2933908 RepID=UPI00329692E0